MAFNAKTRYYGGGQFPAHLRFPNKPAAQKVPPQPPSEPAPVEPVAFPEADVVSFSSGKQRCGINEYSQGLSNQMRLTGAEVSEQLLADTKLLRAAPEGSKLLVHVEPSLLPADFDSALKAAHDRRAKVVCCFHYFDTQLFRRFERVADRLVTHRDYGIQHSNLRQIPLGCPVFEEPDRAELRKKFKFDRPVITTLGFLSAWKKIPELAAALLPELARRGVLFQILCPTHFSGDPGREADRLKGVVGRRPLALWISDFIPEQEMLERAAASDLGVVFHGSNTGSVSAANRMFVSARCPLVLTGSSHDSDIVHGVERIKSLDMEDYTKKVVEVIEDAPLREKLRAGIRKDYEKMNQAVVAKQYLKLFEELS